MPERLPKNDKSKDQINEYNKLGLRIFDISRTNIMLRRYRKTKVWTIPTIDMYDPGKRIEDYVEEALSKLKLHMTFKLIAALPIIRHEEKDGIRDDKDKEYTPTIFRSFIYEIQYSGIIYKSIPEAADEFYDDTLWVRPAILAKMTPLNRITGVLAHMMEKETCLS